MSISLVFCKVNDEIGIKHTYQKHTALLQFGKI